MLADALAEPLADADAEGWEELEPHALSPRAAAGTTPSSRVRRLRGEVMGGSSLYGWRAGLWLIPLWSMCQWLLGAVRCCQPPWVLGLLYASALNFPYLRAGLRGECSARHSRSTACPELRARC